MKKFRVALISCTKLKQDYPCEAKEMYLASELFRKASSYVKRKRYKDWFVLSAKYGLLSKNTIIEPYNETLNDRKKEELLSWSEQVASELLALGVTDVDFYAGERYRKYVIPILESHGVRCNVPLKGMGIGEQMAFYLKNT